MRSASWRAELLARLEIETCEARLAFAASGQSSLGAPELWTEPAQAAAPLEWTALATAQGLSGAGQTVAIIDSGIAYDHPALGGRLGVGSRVVGGWDFTEENDANPYDDAPGGGHGTHVAGIVGSNDPAHPGLAPGVDLVALRVFNDLSVGSFAWVESALRWVHEHRNDFANPITTVNISIGSNWNDSSVPGWSTIEDELAQLDADGMFVAVAAGNAFSTYNAPGLSYPAASRHVVPVASVDADGRLSSFSQRHERALAAPGRSILSTVPDYLGDLNGRVNDFATFTGTSMAAPYVAGAAVLLREALAHTGQPSVNQARLVQILRTTADSVFDPLTRQSYLRVNLARALESVASGGSQPPPPPAEPTPETDLGAVDFRLLERVDLSAAARWYRVETTHSGLLSIAGQSSGGTLRVELYDESRVLVASGTERIDHAVSAGEVFYVRADGTDAGATLRLVNLVALGGEVRVFGTPGDDQFRYDAGAARLEIGGLAYSLPAAARRVRFTGEAGNDSATIVATAGRDTIRLAPGQADLSGSGYRALVSGAETIHVDAGGGADRAILVDSAGNDTFTSYGDRATLVGPGYANEVSHARRIDARAGAGLDAANVHGVAADDRPARSRGGLVHVGVGYRVAARGFEQAAFFAAAALATDPADDVPGDGPTGHRRLLNSTAAPVAPLAADGLFGRLA